MEQVSLTTVGKYVGQAAPGRKAEAGLRPRPVWDSVADRRPYWRAPRG
jgi:hypothetical protein